MHYTANYWRFHEVDFNERSRLGAIAGTGFADWPINYAELEPYYTKVEWEIGVSGLAGASPFDPPRTQAVSDAAAAGEVLRRAVRARRAQARPASVSGADGDQLAALSRPARLHSLRLLLRLRLRSIARRPRRLTTVIPEAEATGRCEVRAESYVVRIETDKRGRATGVHYFDRDQREHFQKAKAVVVCANGAETPRLLLMSASARFPHGLANSSGLVGKYLMFNYDDARAARSSSTQLNEYKSVQVTRILHDFYDSDPKRGFYGGGGIDARIGPQPIAWAQRIADEGRRWGSAYKTATRRIPAHDEHQRHTARRLPLETNSVSLDPELKDAWGMPAMRVTYKDHPDDLATGRFLRDRGAEILEAAGALKVTKAPVESADRVRPPAGHLPNGQRPGRRRSSIATTARTTYRICSSATAAASSRRDAVSRR